MKKEFEDDELFEEMTEDDLNDCDCLMCQASRFHIRFGRYPHPAELTRFLNEERGKC